MGRDHMAPGVAVVAFLWPVAVCVVVGNLFADLEILPLSLRGLALVADALKNMGKNGWMLDVGC